MKTLIKKKSSGDVRSVDPSPVVKILASEHNRAHAAYIGALGAVLFALFFVYKSLEASRQEDRIFVIDGSNTMHVGPLEKLNKNSEFLRTFGLLVNQVIFDRSPDGLCQFELAEHIFRKSALDKLKEEVSSTLEEAKAKNIHQKAEVSSIEVLFDKDIPVLRMDGECIFAGSYEGVALGHGQKYQLIFKLIKNEKLSDIRLYPFIVSDYKIKWE